MKKLLATSALPLFLALALTGCGGGGGGGSSSAPASTLGGVAAVGSPIIAGTINVSCASGSALASTTTSSMGAWQVTLAGQTLPCAVQVSGGTINNVTNTTPYHSIATAPGIVNVTPLTDLIVANLTGTATPSVWFAGLSAAPAPLTAINQASVTGALVKLSAALPALPSLNTINPITTAFTPTSGNVSDDTLTALKTAMTNTGVTYTSLLSNASVPAFTAPVTGFGTALATAYTGTTSGGTPSTATYTIGGTVSGLTGSVVLQDNNSDNLTVGANGTFTFATQVANVSPFNVAVLTQPVGQTCTVSTGAGTVSGGNVANVAVVCSTNTRSVGGTVSGLAGSIVLQDNNGDNLTVGANGTFTFATKVANGSPYSVTVLTHPASQSCSVASGTGTIASANLSNVAVTCATNTYTIGGAVSGLTGSVVLQDNNGDNLTVSTNGTFTFATAVAYGNAYNVSVLTQPSGQTCSVSTGAGAVSGGNVANVAVACSTNTNSVGGSVSGLTGSLILQDNNGDNLTVAANGSFTFATQVANGSHYSVTVLTHPASQSCSVSNGTGAIALANVSNIAITCATNTYTISGTVSGLIGSVVLQDNGGDNLTVSTNGSFTFPTAVAYGNTYSVTVLTQPSGQLCSVTSGSGTATSNITSVASYSSVTINGVVVSSASSVTGLSVKCANITAGKTYSASISPTTYNFGSITIGSKSAENIYQLTNTGTGTLTFAGTPFMASILPNLPYFLSSNTCGVTLAVGASCNLGITFSPTQSGTAASSWVAIQFAEFSGYTFGYANGTGVNTSGLTYSASISPTTYNFGSITIGSKSAENIYQLTNTGTGTLTFAGTPFMASILPNLPYFLSSNTCGVTLAVGASCNLGITFSPTQSGAAASSWVAIQFAEFSGYTFGYANGTGM